MSSKWIKEDVSKRILVLDTSLFIHFDDKYFRTEGVIVLFWVRTKEMSAAIRIWITVEHIGWDGICG